MDKSETIGFVLRRTQPAVGMAPRRVTYYGGSRWHWTAKIDGAAIRAASSLKGAATSNRKREKFGTTTVYEIVSIRRSAEELHAKEI